MNRLSQASSPYLRQHADNPVDWHEWGEQAFARAREENKPIFLSVGYSTCHWCHVMNRESFSDENVAAFMNAHFINIKLDREERPDVDRVYMTYVQATTGSGGWPMSVWLTPALEPIVGGTYFPPENRHGRPGFPTILRRIHEAWCNEQDGIREHAAKVIAQLREVAAEGLPAEPEVALRRDFSEEALRKLAAGFDSDEGGFGPAPKFPRPSEVLFLLDQARRLGPDSEPGARAKAMALFTLSKMISGGIHDHIGGGFHRYSVDRFWHIPHYEKMLYDQAQIASACLEAWRISGEEEFAETARGIFRYVLRDLEAPAGGFFSAEDADSLPAAGASRKTEGAFYIWKAGEIDALLGPEAPLFRVAFGIEDSGNAPPESDPHGELTGTNTLIRRKRDAELAAAFGTDIATLTRKLAASCEILHQARESRPRPHLDDKIITAWNGLLLSALAQGSRILVDDSYREAANRAAKFLREALYDQESKTLRRTWRDGMAPIEGFVEDYAFLIAGLLDLYDAGLDPEWLDWALELQGTQDRLFWDEKSGGYFSSTGRDPNVLLRFKEEHDGAEPSPNTISASNLIRLSRLLGTPELDQRASEALAALAPQLKQSPLVAPLGLVALERWLSPGLQVVLVGDAASEETKRMLEIVRRDAPGDTTLILLGNERARNFFSRHADFYKNLTAIDGKTAAYVCENFTCKFPVTEPEDLRQALEAIPAPRGRAQESGGVEG